MPNPSPTHAPPSAGGIGGDARVEEMVRQVMAESAARLDPISLDELGRAALLDRVDTKFMLPVALVPEVLARCAADYRVLEVDGRRLYRYATRYFDTPDLGFYHAHHGGRLPRRKVRVRSYLDTDQHYLEVKIKTNKDRTVKSRVRLREGLDEAMARLRRRLPPDVEPLFHFDELGEVLRASFFRLTLVSRSAPERVTIDFLLELASPAKAEGYGAIAIAEVKQERQGRSPFLRLMRELGRRDGAISKYCLGVVSLYELAKKNRFKRVLHFIAKTGEDHGALAAGS